MYVYLLHAANDTTATDAAYMGWLSYSALLVVAGVTDEKARGCKQVDLDTLFKAANFEIKGVESNDDNPDLALNRAEWLEVHGPKANKSFRALPWRPARPRGACLYRC